MENKKHDGRLQRTYVEHGNLSAYAVPFVRKAHKAFWQGRRCVAGVAKSSEAEHKQESESGRELCAKKQPYPLPD